MRMSPCLNVRRAGAISLCRETPTADRGDLPARRGGRERGGGVGCAAWVQVFTGDFEMVPDHATGSGLLRAAKFSRSGAAYYEVRRSRGALLHESSGSGPKMEELVPRWTGLENASPPYEAGEVREDYRGVDARGWPMLSLWLELAGPVSPLEVRGGLATSKLRKATWMSTSRPVRRYGHSFPVALPLRPLWPGFAVNTLFYAAVLWLLGYSVFATRRFIRMKRGRCVKCGYPRGESGVCSECGAELPGRTEAAT